MFLGAPSATKTADEGRERASTIHQMTSPNSEVNTETRLHDTTRQTHPSPGSSRFLRLQERTKTLLTRLMILGIYIMSGAAIFHVVESTQEDERTFCHTKGESKVEIEMAKKFNLSMKEIRKIVEDLCLEFEASHKCKYSHNDWSYYQSLYFVGSVTTTIGYGHLAPKTQYGRLFLIFYAFFGIPINLLALQSVGAHINVGFHNLITFTEKKIYKTSRVRHEHIKTFVLSVILMILMLPIGGLMYYYSEKDKGWTYLDSVYYTFVAMSTIGFGDLVPNEGKEPKSTYERVMWFIRLLFLVLGLSLVSSVFTSVSSATRQIKAAYMSKKGKYKLNRKQKSGTERKSFKQVACLHVKDILCSVNAERPPIRHNNTTNTASDVYSRFEDSFSTTSLSQSHTNDDVHSNHVINHVDPRYRSISMALSQASLGFEYTLDWDSNLGMVDRYSNSTNNCKETEDLTSQTEKKDSSQNTNTSTNPSENSTSEINDVKEMTPSVTSSPKDDVRDMNDSESNGKSQRGDCKDDVIEASNSHVIEEIKT